MTENKSGPNVNIQKSIFITGITSGIGSVVLKHCIKENFHITGVVRQESQKDLFKDYAGNGFDLFVADLSEKVQVKNLVQSLRTKEFDYILLNAGHANTGKFHLMPEESIEKTLETNLLSNMRLVHALLPCAIEKRSKIIFVSSLNARCPGHNCVSYATSKAALSQFYSSLRCEYPYLSFLCIEIGPVDTPLHEKSNNIVTNKKNFKSKELIGQRLFDAMKTKTGIHTLSWEWGLYRKYLILADQLLTFSQLKMRKSKYSGLFSREKRS